MKAYWHDYLAWHFLLSPISSSSFSIAQWPVLQLFIQEGTSLNPEGERNFGRYHKSLISCWKIHQLKINTIISSILILSYLSCTRQYSIETGAKKVKNGNPTLKIKECCYIKNLKTVTVDCQTFEFESVEQFLTWSKNLLKIISLHALHWDMWDLSRPLVSGRGS